MNMKTKSLIGFLTALFLLSWGCTNDPLKDNAEETPDQQKAIQTEGYIVGYDPGSGIVVQNGFGEAGGYFIISADLKDTLLTYNLPKGLYNFPEDICSRSTHPIYPSLFPDSYREAFKIQFSYDIASEEELVHNIYIGITLILPFNATQVIIKSASKID
jgi:hypothetical protein